jgi:hypothetical protein
MRHTKTITIPGKSSNNLGERDNGKTYHITEMSAEQAEMWAFNALTLVGQAGVQLPDGIIKYGMAGMAIVGLDALMKVDFAKARPLLEEMMACVQFVPDPKRPMPRKLDEANGMDVEEIRTRLILRDAVFELHTGFSAADTIRAILESAQKMMSPLNTETSPQS